MKTTKTILLLIVFSIMVFFRAHTQTPGFGWAEQVGGDSVVKATSVVVDFEGNQIITGSFKGTADFDPGASVLNLASAGKEDIFIQKLGPQGNLLWAARMGDISSDYGNDVATDASGNIYVTGYFWGTIDADPGPGTLTLSQDRWTTMVLKIEPDGDLIWGKQMGSETAGHAYGRSITVDNNLNVITSGVFYGRVDFDPGPVVVNLTCTSNDIFVQKLDPNGNFMWIKQIIGTEFKNAYSMATDAGGNIYTTGFFKGTVDFNPDRKLKFNLTSFGDYDAFVLKLNGNGDFVWAKQIGGTASDLSYSIALDNNNSLYITGLFWGTADFNPGSSTFNMTPFGGDDAYLLKLTTAGEFVWAKQYGGPSWDGGFGVVLDGAGNSYVGGFFHSTADFDPGSGTYYLTTEGYDDSFIFKSDPAGNLIWAVQTGGPGWDYTLTLAIDAIGNIFNVGDFEQTADFNPNGNGSFLMTNNSGERDMFIQKLTPSGGSNCAVPNGLAAAYNGTTALLGWNPVTGAGGYFVRYREIQTVNWVLTGLITGTSYTLNGLNTGTGYEFQVKTNCESNFSYSYEFVTSVPECVDNYEPNETLATPAPIPANTNIAAMISSYSDKDYFSFSTAATAKNIHITLTGLPADYNIKLYKSDGTLLGSSSNTSLADESIIYNASKAGSYRIYVFGYSGTYDPIHCYTLHVATSSTSFKSAEAEIANSIRTEELTVYPNPSNSTFNFMLETESNELVTIQLFDMSGRLVQEYNSLPPDDVIAIGEDLKPGIYVASVTQGLKKKYVKIIKTN